MTLATDPPRHAGSNAVDTSFAPLAAKLLATSEQIILRVRLLPMHRILFATLFALFVASHAANSETFVGTAAATGTHKRPLLVVDGTRYELKGSDKADGSVADMLAKFSLGDRGTYTITGTRSTVNNNEGIVIDSIIASSMGHVANRVSPNGPNALARFSNTQLILFGSVLLGACVALCILTVGMGYLWQQSRSRNK